MEKKIINGIMAILVVLLFYIGYSGFNFKSMNMNNPAEEIKNTISTETPAKDMFKIAFVNADRKISVLNQLQDEFSWTLKQHVSTYKNDKISVDYFDSGGSIVEQIKTLKNICDGSYNVVVIIPCFNDSNLVDVIRKLAINNNQTFVILDKEINLKLDSVYTVVSDSYQAGKIQAEHISEYGAQNYKVYYLSGPKAAAEESDKLTGFAYTLRKLRPDIQIVHTIDCGFDSEVAKRTVDKWISEGEQINCIVCSNDPLTVGALKSLEEHNLLGSIPIIGADVSNEITKEIQRGHVVMAAHQFIYMEAMTAFNICRELYLGREVIFNHKLKYVPITRNNVITYIDKDKI